MLEIKISNGHRATTKTETKQAVVIRERLVIGCSVWNVSMGPFSQVQTVSDRCQNHMQPTAHHAMLAMSQTYHCTLGLPSHEMGTGTGKVVLFILRHLLSC